MFRALRDALTARKMAGTEAPNTEGLDLTEE
jgi:hypothetical protein